jgi:hypothetical protein
VVWLPHRNEGSGKHLSSQEGAWKTRNSFLSSPTQDAIERAAAALQLATNMMAFDAKIDFFL